MPTTCTSETDRDPSPVATAPRNRASWTGLMQVSLVAVPVKAYPAVSTSDEVHFNQLHADCGQRIAYQKRCPVHGAVDAGAIVRGYQYAPGQYVVIDAAELEALRPAKEKALLVEQFVEGRLIDPVLFSGRTLYLLPDGLAAQRSYLVLVAAMQQRGQWGLGRVVLSGIVSWSWSAPWGGCWRWTYCTIQHNSEAVPPWRRNWMIGKAAKRSFVWPVC